MLKKILLIILTLVCLSACGQIDRQIASIKGHTKLCIDGVEYIQFTSGASVAYSPEGKIKTCN